jgi:hypothetical protein
VHIGYFMDSSGNLWKITDRGSVRSLGPFVTRDSDEATGRAVRIGPLVAR